MHPLPSLSEPQRAPCPNHVTCNPLPSIPLKNLPKPPKPLMPSSSSLVSGTPSPIKMDDLPFDLDCTLPTLNWTNTIPILAKSPPQTQLQNAPPTRFDITPHQHPVLPILSHEFANFREARYLLAIKISEKTIKENNASLMALATSCLEHYRAIGLCNSEPQAQKELFLYRKYLIFPGGARGHLPSDHVEWTDRQLKHIGYHLIEFFANYKYRTNGNDLSPSKIKTFVLGINSPKLFRKLEI